MKRLKHLITYGTDEEILSYVKGDFISKIDEYLNIDSEISQLKKDLLDLSKKGYERQKELDRFMEEADKALSAIRREDPYETALTKERLNKISGRKTRVLEEIRASGMKP